MKNKQSTNTFKSVTKTIRRFNMTIFIVVLSVSLMASILILSNILLSQSSGNNPASAPDQTTIDLLNKLTTSDNSSNNQVLPSGRINPFSG